MLELPVEIRSAILARWLPSNWRKAVFALAAFGVFWLIAFLLNRVVAGLGG